jgi:spermidine/putrescine transport system permease protein
MIEAFKTKKNRFLPHFFLSIALLFFYIPLSILVTFSFNTHAFPSPWDQFTLKWYHALFNDGELWSSFFNSCLVSISSTSLCILLTTCMLFFLSKGGRIKHMISLFYGNLLFPETVIAVALVGFFSALHISLGLVTIIIAHSVVGLGLMIPTLFLKYQDIDQRILEASQMLGASSFQTFYKIVLPLLRPALIATGLMVFIISFDDFILSYFCAGTGVETLSLFLVSTLRYGVSPNINALASLLLIFTALLVALFLSIKQEKRIL